MLLWRCQEAGVSRFAASEQIGLRQVGGRVEAHPGDLGFPGDSSLKTTDFSSEDEDGDDFDALFGDLDGLELIELEFEIGMEVDLEIFELVLSGEDDVFEDVVAGCVDEDPAMRKSGFVQSNCLHHVKL